MLFTLPDYEMVVLNLGAMCMCRAGERNGERLDNKLGGARQGIAKRKREGRKRTGAKYRALHPTPCARMHSADTAMGTGLSPHHPPQETMSKRES